jgi:DNA invertase Pin-like site-specific DNA recombinase
MKSPKRSPKRNAKNTSEKPSRLLGYCRVSTAEQAAGGVSLDDQRAKIAAYAQLYGLEIVDVIIDDGVSAKTLDRPGLRRALAMLDAGEADGLLVTKLDRLTRSVRDLGELLDTHFGEGGCALLSVADQIDTRTAGGRLVLNVLTSVAQWEREAIAERTSSALCHIRDVEGFRLGGVPIGYLRASVKAEQKRRALVPNPAELPTVDRIVELDREGLSLRAIADRLTTEGHATKRGGRWQAQTIANVLRRAA